MDLNRATLDDHELRSGDGYTWQAVVESWRQTGRWSPRVATYNAPYGVETHLTLPYAALVMVLARPVAELVPPEDATRVAGMLSGPLLHLAAAVVLAWGATAVVGPGGAIAAVAAAHGMLGFAGPFRATQFDHHALHMTLALGFLALLLRYAVEHRIAYAASAGTAAGVGIWAGVEMLVAAGFGGLGLGFCWATLGGAWRARGCFAYAVGMAVALLTALVVDAPLTGWDALDRVSGAHGLMGAMLVAAAGVVTLVQHRRPNIAMVPRFAVGVAATVCVAAVMWAAVDDFYLGPYGVVDAAVLDHFDRIPGEQGMVELLHAWPDLLGYHLWLGVLVAGRTAAGLRGPQRDAWTLLAVGLAVGGMAAFLRYRLVWQYEIFACVALGGLAVVGSLLWRRSSILVRAASLPAMLLLMLSPYVGLMIGARFAPAEWALWPGELGDEYCDWMALGKGLEALSAPDGGTIVTYAGPGPELAHFSGRGVVATGCHCNPGGMRDALAILLSPADAAQPVARQRRVAWVVQCPARHGWQGHDWYLERSGADGVYARLARGEPPDWLVPVPPTALGVDGFIVHRTTLAAPGHDADDTGARQSVEAELARQR